MNPTPEQKGRGCFFYGCLTLVILVLVGTVGTVLGVRYWVNKKVIEYTDAQGVALPKSDITPTEAAELSSRFKAFQQGIKDGKPVQALELNGRELNGLLASNTNLAKIKDHFYLSIDKEELKGELSLPLQEIGFDKYAGRYLNGSASLKATMENGVLIVTLQSLNVKGLKLPPQAIAQMRGQNLAQELYKDPNTAEWMRKIESIQVKDGKITVRAREPNQAPATDPKPEAASTF